MQKKHIIAAAVLLLALHQARAQDLKPQDTATQTAPTKIGKIVVTANRTETLAENVGNAATVITREQIEQSQAQNVAEVLRDVPGVAIVQSGGQGGQTAVFLRGANSNQTLILIDGARINGPLNGLAPLSNIDLTQVERIEIVRGPQSTVYGADAIGGVINIITRTGAEKFGGDVSFEGGSHNTFRESANIRGAHKNLDYAVSVSRTDTDNRVPNSDYENTTVGANAGYRFNDRVKLRATIRYTDAEVGVPGAIPPGPDLTERLFDEIIFGRAVLDVTLADWWQSSVSVADTHDDLRDRLGAFGPSDSRTNVLQVLWQNTFPITETDTLVAGLDWHQNQGFFSGFGSVFDVTVDNIAGFIQNEITLWDRLVLTGGGRFDHHSQFGDAATYRFAGVFKFPTHTRLKASVGTAFKAPTLNDLFFPFFSNPNLKPEESFGWDAGIEQDLFDGKAMVGVRFFVNEFNNLIAFPPPTFLPNNVAKARTNGVEFSAEARPCETVTVRGGYTYLETEDESTGLRLLRRPQNSGNVGVDWQACKHFALHTDATFVGPRLDVGNVNNPGYIKWDAAFTADVCQWFQLFGRMENILDDQYEEARGFPALGWTWYLGGKMKF